ncbi:MAG: MFS transporter [Ruminococcaceae bacterium]|nr:MFS transporter [Oscillospiraceae bacterium]
METKLKDEYKSSRIMYIIEAALEYFIAIAVGTVYLAKITSEIGIPDNITGILTSFVSLGCGFQVIALFLAHKKPVKRWVTIFHVISQLLFSAMYFVPLLPISRAGQTVLLICSLLLAQILHNAINSPKINWCMSLVDEDKRGRFTANKEIVSLLGGMVFSFALGQIMDSFSKSGKITTGFLLCGVMLLFLTALHTLTLVFTKEKPSEQTKKLNIKEIFGLFKNKTILKVVCVFVLWNVASYITTSYMGAYQVNDLGFSPVFASVVIIIGSLVRATISRPVGKFADRFSFCKMLYFCFGIEVLAFLTASLITPANGKYMYIIYYVLYCIGCAGTNSAIINLIYDYVDFDKRTSALALVNTASGFAGFFATLAVSPLVKHIQENKNKLFGIEIYAQQLLALCSAVIVAGIIVYLLLVISKLKKHE